MRHSHSQLIESAISDSVLMEAWYKVRANHGRAGTDGVTVDAFARRLFEHLGRLRSQVQTGSYAPQPRLQLCIPREGKAPRCLAIPTVRDRVLQCAVSLVLNPLLDPLFEDSSYAYRAGRSTRMAIEEVIRLRDEGWRWVVDADIHSFFDEIDHTTLLAKLEAACRDPAVVDLVRCWIKAPIRYQDGRSLRPERGVGQGSPISPLLANLYLDELDEFIAAQGWRHVRFADDFLILCRRREEAESALELTEEALAGLALRFSPEKTRLTHFSEGFGFLGVRFEDQTAFAESPRAAPWLEPLPRPAFSLGEPGPTAMAVALARAGQGPPRPAPARPRGDGDAGGTGAAEVAAVEIDEQAPPHLRTLYLVSPGLALLRSGERLTVVKEGRTLREVPVHTIDQVLAMGHCMLSSAAIALCVEKGVGLHVLRPTHQLAAHLLPSAPEAVALRRAQYRATADTAFCLEVAKCIVAAKIQNSRAVIARFLRHHPADGAGKDLDALSDMARRVNMAVSLDEARGCEGNAARAYFALLRRMLPEGWNFVARLAHPPADAVNAMLSYGYAILYANVASVVCRRGLDAAFGFLHAPRKGRAALVSDLMEPYRAAVVDATVLTLLFRHRVKMEEFETLPGASQPTRMTGRVRQTLIHALEQKLDSRPGGVSLDFRRLLARDADRLATAIESGAGHWAPHVL